MSKSDKSDGLFLLEALVDKIIIEKAPCFAEKDFRTCVSIKCMDVEPLIICDDDDPTGTATRSAGAFVKNINSGKSCLFSLSDGDISKAMSNFPISVNVYKELACGCIPTKILLGEAQIDMTKEFVDARNKYLEDPNAVAYQALKDSFRLFDEDGNESGELFLFLRISCFGKLIVTRFQGSADPPKLGGDRDANIIDHSCNPERQFQKRDDPCVCGSARGASSGAKTRRAGAGSGPCPVGRDPYGSMPCQDPDEPCYCSGPKAMAKQQMACRNVDPYCLHIPKDCCPPGNKIVFQLPSDICNTGHRQRTHFNLNSDGIANLAREEPGQLTPAKVDYPQQVYKLRFGKSIELPGRKTKLEYQFIVPVVTREKVVSTKDTRTAQCVCTCPTIYETALKEEKRLREYVET